MYKNVCRHCHAEIECDSKKIFANHVRWCNPEQDNLKYILRCSCLVCQKETTAQSLKLHLKKHDDEEKIKALCKHCSNPIYTKRTQFCSQSCSASFYNSKRDYSKIRVGPEKGWQGPAIPWNIRRARKKGLPDPKPLQRRVTPKGDRKQRVAACWIGFCKCCGKLFHRKYSSHDMLCCSKECRMSIVALNRGRHKKSYLEKSFSDWLISHGVQYETEKTIKNQETGKWYFVDFIFEDLRLIIELDGSHHEQTKEYDTVRDEFLSSLGYRVLRITHKEYQSKEKLQQVCDLLNIKN